MKKSNNKAYTLQIKEVF